MNKDILLELMHDYISQYGLMGSFLDFCEEQEGYDKEDVEESIKKFIY
jgi:hypothetical protein